MSGEVMAEGGAAAVTKEKVFEILGGIYDPEIPVDIVNLGLVYNIEIEGGEVRILMTMTSPGCPAAGQIVSEAKLLTSEIEGVEKVDIEVVWDPPWTPEMMSEAARESFNI
ncbi:MAG: iron-sulfur cluster assembly protein [Candidatus Dadabacteria bacterium]|nr:iron-sulfur cluster assembly protein [Candidatus Dadabacteria bacterium]